MITQLNGRLVSKTPTTIVVDCNGVGYEVHIGANTARTVLSSMNPQEVVQAIQTDNVAAIQAVKGIGAKTAQRVIVDLRDKVTGLVGGEEIALVSNNTQRDEALSALGVLGYPMKQTQKVVDALLQVEPDMPVDRLIKNALNKL